jgi:hypothetical protein
MSLPAQPNAPEHKSTEKHEKPATVVTKKPEKQEPRSYFAMMLLAVLTLPTGLARAYRGEQGGWTRFWVYVGSNLIMIIPILGQLIGGIALIVLSIIGAVDVFKLRKTTTDAFGHPLVMTEKDKQWANGFYIYFLVTLVIIALVILLVTTLLGTALGHYLNNGNGSVNIDPFRGSEQMMPQQYSEPSSF